MCNAVLVQYLFNMFHVAVLFFCFGETIKLHCLLFEEENDAMCKFDIIKQSTFILKSRNWTYCH